MGRDIDTTEFSREDRVRYRDKVKANLAALRQLMDAGRFETGRRLVGVEMEVYLTDPDGHVTPINAQLLDRIASDDFQTELAQFNIEFQIRPRRLVADVCRQIEDELRASLERAHAKAETLGAQVMIIGILPTLSDFDVTEQNLSANPRYRALNDAILAARGEDILIRIEGDETLETTANSIVFEAACTSVQLHLQVDPADFATAWNAAQAVSAPLVATAANSPFFLGKQLHHETRIALFQQSIDTRTEELATQGVRPRVWFGEKWLTEGIFELFDENVRYFPALLPLCDDEDPQAMLAAGDIPHLPELTLHNGTIYRWNRPVYDVARGRPHVRIENRVLPAGPTVVDVVANTALYYGLLAGLAAQEPPVWQQMSFDAATENFYAAARYGLGAKLYWPGVGAAVPVSELILRHLLPVAAAGLRSWDVAEADIDRYLGIIEARVLSGRNGAAWQIATYRQLVEEQDLERPQAASELVRRYQKLSQIGEPVHTWPVGG
ncbi:MAG TPA: glutamate-cysteine ligase family protein [Egibacteraceae bacterium]|jgi:gamma-glutamyl:cysteine ligase YbdK (ATP-grasp superfamily)|nr:glutamate-cysteine ligase family protein [Egibacteraceae bacterium]